MRSSKKDLRVKYCSLFSGRAIVSWKGGPYTCIYNIIIIKFSNNGKRLYLALVFLSVILS